MFSSVYCKEIMLTDEFYFTNKLLVVKKIALRETLIIPSCPNSGDGDSVVAAAPRLFVRL